MRKYLFLIFLVLACPLGIVQAQSLVTFKGKVLGTRAGSSEVSALPGATVYLLPIKKGMIIDLDGTFSLEVPADFYELQVTFPGYESFGARVDLRRDTSITITLVDKEMEEVVISESKESALEIAELSVEEITMTESNKVMAFLGENDIIRTLQLKPGISSGGEGFTGLYVRGGGPDQNLFLYDGAVLYNPSHLFGFFSTFNSDAVKGVELYKSSFPAEYGGRLSSVVDVEGLEGNHDSLEIGGGIGILASRLSLAGPFAKGKGSYRLTGRRTYFDIFTRILNRANQNDKDYQPIPSYFFYDLNGKADYKINDKQKLTFSSYFGQDVFGFDDRLFRFRFRWGNRAAILGHEYILNDKWKLDNKLYYSNYQYRIKINNYGLQTFSVGAGIDDYGHKTKAMRYSENGSVLTLGMENSLKRFDVGTVTIENASGTDKFTQHNYLYAIQNDLFANYNWIISPRFMSMAGLRLSTFSRKKHLNWGLEPRLAMKYQLTDKLIGKLGYARMYQYAHLASNSGASLPTDIWYPSGANVKPQRSDQLAGGWEFSFGKNDMFRFSNEYYYKWMDNLIDFKNGADLTTEVDLDREFVFGNGDSYGGEVYLEKKKGKLTGWIGYTLAWAWRTFPSINNGERFHPRYDRRHDLSLVVIYELSDKWNLGFTWVYGTGNLMTLPTGFFPHEDIVGTNDVPPAVELIPIYENRNNYRMRPYHRMDINLSKTFKGKRYDSELKIGLYNAYNRRNPFFIFFDQVQNDPANGGGVITGIQAKEVSLFPILPSVTYNFKF